MLRLAQICTSPSATHSYHWAKLFSHAAITVRRRWQKVRDEAGSHDVVMHDLRRTHATHAVTAGVDLRTLAGRSGHSDLDMLQKHYAALMGSAAEEAADKIEASLTGNRK